MTHIDTAYWKRIGGDPKRPPYIDTAPTSTGGKLVRVFVSALWHRDWATWKRNADMAINTALYGENPVVVAGGIMTEAITFSNVPRYLLNRSRNKWGGPVEILLNAAAIQTEEDFNAVMLVAEADRRLVEKGQRKNSSTTQYDIRENAEGRTVFDDSKDSTQESRDYFTYLCSDKSEGSREAAVRRMMDVLAGGE